MKLLAIAAALFAVQPQPGLAQPNPPPVSEAMLDRFVASLPKTLWPGSAPSDFDPEELKAFVALNPGKDAQIVAILRAFETCTAPAVDAGVERGLRTVARDLGAEKLQRLIELFAGPDWALLDAATERVVENPYPAAADLAEVDRLSARYPIEEFGTAFAARMQELAEADETFAAAVVKCGDERAAALAKAGLKAP